MTKKLLITLSIFALFANGTKASDNNSATHDEGVVINGVRWATRNVDMPGTFAELPESAGMFFQWNRKKAWSEEDEEVIDWEEWYADKWYAEDKEMTDWDSFYSEDAEQYAENDYFTSWDYSAYIGTKWYAENDPCPPGWRVPTADELRSLGRVASKWTRKNGVNGRLFGTAPYHLFLPATGSTFVFDGANGWYWSNTFEEYRPMSLWFNNSDRIVGTQSSANGFSIRCVAIE